VDPIDETTKILFEELGKMSDWLTGFFVAGFCGFLFFSGALALKKDLAIKPKSLI